MLLATPLFCLALATCRDTLGPSPRLPAGPGALVTVEDTLPANSDTYLSKSSPNQNFGGNDGLKVGGTSRFRVLVQFDSALIRQAVGAGQLDSARLEFTIQANPDGWGSTGRQVDLHRMTRSWTESGATWNCAVDVNTANSVPDCPTNGWDMTNQGQAPYVSNRTARVTVTNGQTGVIRLDVTPDVAGLLAGTVHQGWIFRKYSESEYGQALVLARESGNAPRLILAVTADTSRPAIPQWGYPKDSLYTTQDPVDTSFTYYRRLVRVRFHDTASGSSINSFLAKYNAQIVGGIKAIVPQYVLQLPDPGPGWTALDSILSSISAEPIVRVVVPIFRRMPAPTVEARFPSDGSNLSPGDWKRPTGDTTWALRAVRAPLAWGCETGIGHSPAVSGLIEWDLDEQHPEFLTSDPQRFDAPSSVPNTATSSARIDSLRWHGTAAAGAMTAQGDNGQGTAGVLWRTALRMYALGSPSGPPTDEYTAFLEALAQVLTDSVRVLSLSVELPKVGSLPQLQSDLESGFRDLLGANSKLLVLKATGNNDGDITPMTLLTQTHGGIAIRAALLQLRATGFASQIAFVTGTQPGSQYSGQTYIRGATDIGAPGRQVALLAARSGTQFLSPDGIILADGTSFATPIVAGIAAAVASMDPTINPAEIKAALIAGAGAAKQPIANIPGGEIVYEADAYGALKQVAERFGTPLCGNRVWAHGAEIWASRGTGKERLFVAPDTVGLLNVRHGGRRIDFVLNGVGDTAIVFQNGTWSFAPSLTGPDLPNATWHSLNGMTHDGDSVVIVNSAPTSTGRDVTVSLGTPYSTGRLLSTFTVPLQQAATPACQTETGSWDSTGTFLGYQCSASIQTGDYQTSSFTRTVPPQAGVVLLTVNRDANSFLGMSSWIPCYGATADPQGNLSCRTRLAQYQARSDSAKVYEIPWAGGSEQFRWGRPDRTVHWLGLAEDGSSGVMATSLTVDGVATNCAIEYFTPAAGALLPAPDSVVANPVACAARGTGGMAPLRAASRQR